MPDDLEAGPHVLQHLGDILAQLAQPAAAVGAGGVIGQMGVNLARKMLRQRAAKRLRGNWPFPRRSRSLLFDGLGRVELFELQLKLLDLAKDLLALRSEEHPLQLVDKHLQPLDLGRPRAQRGGIGLMLRQDHGP
jgi:hypothetical protein